MRLRKILMLVLPLLAILAGGYFWLNAKDRDLVPERFFAEDSLVMFSLDFSDGGQRMMVADLLEKFGDGGFLDSYFADAEFDYPKLKEVFAAPFKLTFGLEGADASVFSAVGKFDRADEMEEVVLALEGIERLDSGAVDVWQIDDGFIARYGDFFVFTDRSEVIDTVQLRAVSVGFDSNDKYLMYRERFGEENLGYVFMDGENIGDQFDEIYSFWGESFKNSVAGIEDVYMTMVAEESGLRFVGESTLDEEIDGTDYQVRLFKQVPSEGVISYSEGPNLNQLKDLIGDYLVNSAGFGEETVGDFLDKPSAFVMSDVGEVYPGFSFYVDTGEELGREVSLTLDSFVDEIIAEFDGLFAGLGDVAGEGALSRETVVVRGGGMRKIVLDWEALPAESLSAWSFPPVFDVRDVEVALYYGVTGEGLFVLALEPALEERYGADSLEDDDVFAEAFSALGGGMRMSYLRPEGFGGLFDRYLEFAKLFGVLNAEGEADYEKFKKVLKTLRYFVGGSSFERGALQGMSYLRVE